MWFVSFARLGQFRCSPSGNRMKQRWNENRPVLFNEVLLPSAVDFRSMLEETCSFLLLQLFPKRKKFSLDTEGRKLAPFWLVRTNRRDRRMCNLLPCLPYSSKDTKSSKLRKSDVRLNRNNFNYLDSQAKERHSILRWKAKHRKNFLLSIFFRRKIINWKTGRIKKFLSRVSNKLKTVLIRSIRSIPTKDDCFAKKTFFLFIFFSFPLFFYLFLRKNCSSRSVHLI